MGVCKVHPLPKIFGNKGYVASIVGYFEICAYTWVHVESEHCNSGYCCRDCRYYPNNIVFIMRILHHLHITKPGTLPLPFNQDDGIGLALNGENLYVHECIVDFAGIPLKEQDGAVDITYGTAAKFSHCVFRNVGKLSLIGSGDKHKLADELGCKVVFDTCLFENFGRRGPEVQSGMHCILQNCVIRNWGDSANFTVRSFGAWAHDGGSMEAVNCVFVNSNTLSLWQNILDRANHISQAVLYDGIKALFRRFTYTPGWRRGLTGNVQAVNCYASDGVVLQGNTTHMRREQASRLVKDVEGMAHKLMVELGC